MDLLTALFGGFVIAYFFATLYLWKYARALKGQNETMVFFLGYLAHVVLWFVSNEMGDWSFLLPIGFFALLWFFVWYRGYRNTN